MKPVIKYWVIATLVIWILTLATCKSSIEEDLISRSKQTLGEADADWTTITASGRDLVVEGESLNETQSESIVASIEAVNGVRVVDSSFTILPPLVERANSALKANKLDWVDVDGDSELLTLTGKALIQDDIDEATASVSNLRGLNSLDNKIELLPPLPTRAKTLLELDGINWVQIEGNDTDLTLTGEANSQNEIEVVLNNLSSLRGLKHLDNKLSLLPPLVERARNALDAAGFEWVKVEGETDHLVLSGNAFDSQSVNDALTSVKDLSGLIRLTNKLNLHAPIEDRAQSVLDDNNVKWVNLKFSNNDITVTGSTVDASMADRLIQQISSLEGVGTVNNNIDLVDKLNAEDCQDVINELLNSEKIQFETGSANINKKSQLLLLKLANTSRQCPDSTIVVMGHTDNTGDEDSNIKLSKKRSRAVVNNLIAKGVTASRLTAIGLGPWYPIDSNTTEEGRQKNRRIEFKVN